MSLLDKLKEHFKSPCHNRSSKIAKKLCALVLATGMTIAPMALSACNCSTPNPDAGTNPPIVNPDNGGADIGGNTGNGNNQTPGNNNGGSNNGGSSNENDYSQYSQLLQNVLNDEYYNSLISQAKENPTIAQSAYFASHPYAFLEEQGIDVDQIKRGYLSCETYAFTKTSNSNNIILITHAENASGYFDEFILEYELTDEERKDYSSVNSFPNNTGVTKANAYYQKCFINDQLSKNKTPISVNHKKISIAARDSLKEDADVLELANGANAGRCWTCDIVLKDYNVEENTATFIVLPLSGECRSVVDFTCSGEYSVYGVTVENGVFTKPYNFGSNLTLSETNSVLALKSVYTFGINEYTSFADFKDDIQNNLETD